MAKDQISMRQMMVLLFTALLSPAIRVLPARTAEMAGALGWASTLLALPVLWALCWILSALFQDTPEGMGLGERLQDILGRPLGKGVIALYLLWGLFLLCANTRLFGLRFLSTSYRNAPLGMFIAVLAALIVWITRKKFSAFARAAEIFYLALALILATALLFGMSHIEMENLLPMGAEKLPEVAASAGPALAMLSYGIFAAFLGGHVRKKPENRGQSIKWAAALCLVLTLLQVVCLGNFSPQLTQRMDTPFFMMVKGIGVRGAFERIESLVIALWVLSDLAFLGLLAFACCAMVQSLFGLKEYRSAALPVGAIALTGALLLFPSSFALTQWMERAVYLGNLLLGLLAPLGLFLILRVKKRREGALLPVEKETPGPAEKKREKP